MRHVEPRMISWRLAAVVTLTVALLAVSPVASALALGACVVAALIGPAYALRALAAATLIGYANPAIIKLTPFSGELLRLVLIAAVLRVLPMLRGSDLRFLWPLWLFGLLSAATSLVTSLALEISIMKVITFTLAATTVLVAYARLHGNQLLKIESWFLTLGLTVIVLSALTLLKPGLGIGLDGGLQGLLGQPQALGIFMAPFAAWSLTGVLLMRRRTSRLELWVALGTLTLIFLTRARTAAFATIFAVAVVLVSRMLSRRRAQHAPLGKPLLIMAAVALLVAGTALATGIVSKLALGFAYKGTEREQHSLGGAFYDSRGGGILTEWHNFLRRPLIGNGFGVYPDGKFPSGVIRFAGIPISAATEKGFLPTAILEEGGLVGATALTLLVAWIGRLAWRAPDLRWRAMFIACLGINVGECVFLSPGGIGMIDWLLVGLAVSAYRAPIMRPRVTQAIEVLPQGAPSASATVDGLPASSLAR